MFVHAPWAGESARAARARALVAALYPPVPFKTPHPTNNTKNHNNIKSRRWTASRRARSARPRTSRPRCEGGESGAVWLCAAVWLCCVWLCAVWLWCAPCFRGCALITANTRHTTHYIKVLQRKQYNGVTADVWSCGVTLFVMLVGQYPFEDPADPRNFSKTIKVGV